MFSRNYFNINHKKFITISTAFHIKFIFMCTSVQYCSAEPPASKVCAGGAVIKNKKRTI